MITRLLILNLQAQSLGYVLLVLYSLLLNQKNYYE